MTHSFQFGVGDIVTIALHQQVGKVTMIGLGREREELCYVEAGPYSEWYKPEELYLGRPRKDGDAIE